MTPTNTLTPTNTPSNSACISYKITNTDPNVSLEYSIDGCCSSAGITTGRINPGRDAAVCSTSYPIITAGTGTIINNGNCNCTTPTPTPTTTATPTNTPTVTPSETPSPNCYEYRITDGGAGTSVFSFNGCCAWLGVNSYPTYRNEVTYVCSTTLPTGTNGGTVQLTGDCPSCQQQQQAFISNWTTTTSNETIYLPYLAGGTYSGVINWGDGTASENSYANRNHTYTNSGTYEISIYGDIQSFSFQSVTTSNSNITSITQWGDLTITAGGVFVNCDNLTLTGVTDTIILTGTTSLEAMFGNCTSLTTINNLGQWNVSGITTTSGMFLGATSFNDDISQWNTNNVTDMSSMFNGATSFNTSFVDMPVANVTNFSLMFKNATSFNQSLAFNTASATNMSSMFEGATSFNGDMSSFNTGNVTDMGSMFKNATSIDQDVIGSNFNVYNVTDMSYMFYSATSFTIGLNNWNVSYVTDMTSMFEYATSFNHDLSSWCVQFIPSAPTNFDNGATSWILPNSRPIWGTCTSTPSSLSILNLDASTYYSGTPTTWTDYHNHVGTLVNGPTYNSSNGGSIVFDGTDDWASFANLTSLDSQTITMESWCYLNSTLTQQAFLFEKGSVNTQYSNFFYTDGNFYFRTIGLSNQDLNFTTSSYMTANTWFHVVCTYESGTKTIYVNGSQVAQLTGITGTISTDSTGLFLGAYYNGPFNQDFFLNGRIAISRVYNVALSSTQITTIFNGEKSRFGY
jgi:surface protein